MIDTASIEEVIMRTDASGAPVRLEYVHGRLKVEASPTSRHQITIDRIRAGLRPRAEATANCGCYSLADTLIRFPDQSLKRPDIAIFCTQPPETDAALETLPAAVIEILSLGYEEKDLGEDGVPFYLAHGIGDVLVVDPRARRVLHFRPDLPVASHSMPATIDLRCGCRCAV